MEAGKVVPTASDFEMVGHGSGTHLLKLVTPRAALGQCVVRIETQRDNRRPELFPSLDARKSPIAKVVFRPLEVVGHQTRSLADHIRNPDDLSPTVTKGFADAFGEDALDVLRTALTTPLPPITKLAVAEFPIIFLPRPGGGDLQATPLAPAVAYVRHREVRDPYFQKHEEGQPRPPLGRWQQQHVADKPQNISSAVGKQRTRFLATMPRMLDQWSADLHRCSASCQPAW